MSADKRLRDGLWVCLVIASDVVLSVGASWLHLNFAASGFAHLLWVVIVALRWGFWPATLVSVLANVGMNFYLVPPTGSFAVADPQNLIALVVFEICALIVSQLSSHAEHQKSVAVAHRRELERLCSFSRRLLLLNRSIKPSLQILRLIEDEFATRAALFLDGLTTAVQVISKPAIDADALSGMEAAVKACYFQNQDTTYSDNQLFVRVMRLGSTPTGAIGLYGTDMTPFLATAISFLCAISLEREKALDRESQQVAEQKGEQLRIAVLDSLAHEYKTPLTVIRTAAGGLLEIGDLAPFESEMVKLIDLQTNRLDSITSQLLQSSRIDGRTLRLELEPIDSADFMAGIAETLKGRELEILLAEDCRSFIADRKLITMALAQYLDNAAKYSGCESIITVALERRSRDAVISVHNFGSYIPHSERDQIFDRFHRAPSVVDTVSGTGIGLSIVRKVATAHGGKAWVASDASVGTTFFLSLPARANQKTYDS